MSANKTIHVSADEWVRRLVWRHILTRPPQPRPSTTKRN